LLAICFDRTDAQMQALLAWYDRMGMIAFGAWNGEQLVGQYAVLKRHLHLPDDVTPRLVGLSLNMAIHPDFRGRGLVKQMSAPTYAQLAAEGGIAGVGFSSAEGVKVDRNSKSYGYAVVGQMRSWVALPALRGAKIPLTLQQGFPETFESFTASPLIRFAWDAPSWSLRYNAHPFRTYQSAVSAGSVLVFREVGKRGVSLLAGTGANLQEGIRAWGGWLREHGKRYVHFISTPNAHLIHTMRRAMTVLPMPFSRQPQYLTVKPIAEHAALLDFHQWDCTGGDVL
jgi:hypothetical protein